MFFKVKLQRLWAFSQSLCGSFPLPVDTHPTRHVTIFDFFELLTSFLCRSQQCQVSIFSPYRPISLSKEMTEAPENKRMEP